MIGHFFLVSESALSRREVRKESAGRKKSIIHSSDFGCGEESIRIQDVINFVLQLSLQFFFRKENQRSA